MDAIKNWEEWLVLKKCFQAYAYIITVCVSCCVLIVLIDCSYAMINGTHILLPELGLMKFRVNNTGYPSESVIAANQYLESIYSNGYSKNDFLHEYMSIVPALGVINTIYLYVATWCGACFTSKTSKAITFGGVLSLLLIVCLRIAMHGAYGNAEIMAVYPFAYLFEYLFK